MHAHSRTNTQPEVMSSKGFEVGQQGRQFNLREREGEERGGESTREMVILGDRVSGTETRGVKVMARTCLRETERKWKKKKSLIATPLLRKRVSGRMWGSRNNHCDKTLF